MTKKRDLLKEDNLTYGDYAEFDDGNRYELVDGRLELMSPGPNSLHQVISFQLQKRIAHTCERDAIILNAPIDVILSPRGVRQPDLVILLNEHLDRLISRGIEGAPDLVVEILSPSTARRDKISKMASYANHGIPEYWIVEPVSFFLEQYILTQGRYSLTEVYTGKETVQSSLLPCLSFTMQEIVDSVPSVLK